MDIRKFNKVSHALQKSWSAETSSVSQWSVDNPSQGQCTVTACVLQDYFGGDVENCIATSSAGDETSHYLNYIDGKYIDLTSGQFVAGTTFSKPQPKTKGFTTTREYCLSNANTNNRYEILKEKVKNILIYKNRP